MAEQGFYIGIDIDDTCAVTSFFKVGMKEPATVSMVAGSEVFLIPVQITKKKGIGQWFIGAEAERAAQEQQATVVDSLFSRAMNQEELLIDGERYFAEELLVLFLKKLFGYAGSLQGTKGPETVAISVEKLDKDISKFLLRIGNKLGFSREQFIILDRKAAFYYFTLNQHEDLWLHEVCLYDYRNGQVKCLRLERNLSTEPQMVTIEEDMAEIDGESQDETFCQLLQSHMRGHIVSSVYLVGDAFDGNWMNLSLAFMCRGRRAFMGKNLYAKGACYAAMVVNGALAWRFAYLGDNEMKVNVSLKVKNRGREEFYTLLSAGDNWYEAEGSCEVIMDDTKEVAIWLQVPNSRQAKVETLYLSDLPKRQNRTTRLRIDAKPLSDAKIQIMIKDLGFGEIVKSSDMSWEYTVIL